MSIDTTKVGPPKNEDPTPMPVPPTGGTNSTANDGDKLVVSWVHPRNRGIVEREEKLTWDDISGRLKDPQIIPLADSDDANQKKAEAGGWVPGARFRDHKRNAGHFIDRSIVALDVDGPVPDETWTILEDDPVGRAYAAHTTYQSKPDCLRWRILIPLGRPVGAEEYRRCTRELARRLGLDKCGDLDKTCEQPERLMYRPAAPERDRYESRISEDGALMWDADELLAASAPLPSVTPALAPQSLAGIPTFEELDALAQEAARYEVALVRAQVKATADEAKKHEERDWKDEKGRGWEKICLDMAWRLALYAVVPWAPYDEDQASQDYEEWLGPLEGNDPDHVWPSKWTGAIQAVLAKCTDWPPVPGVKEIRRTIKGKLERDPETGKVYRSVDNLDLIVSQDPDIRHVGVSTMGHQQVWRQLPSWRPPVANLSMATAAMTDGDMAQIRGQISRYFDGALSAVSREAVNDALDRYANGRTFSPVRDYLEQLPEWDGTARIHHPISTVESSPYTDTAFSNWFIGGIQRTYDPGCQLDTMLVLVGGQGIRKTSWFRAMAPSHDLMCEISKVPDEERGKDALARCQESFVVVADELDKLLRGLASQSEMKDFISKREDKWRPPYAHKDTRSARQFILGGTTNEEEFLPDLTGNRRYNPVEITGLIPPEELAPEYRDQLWAEALHRYWAGERVNWSEEFAAQAAAVAWKNTINPMGQALLEWLSQEEAMDRRQDRLSVGYIRRQCDDPVFRGGGWGQANGTQQRQLRKVLDTLPGWHRAPGRLSIEGVQYDTVWVRLDG